MIEGKPDTSQRDGSPGTRHMEVRDQKWGVLRAQRGLVRTSAPGRRTGAGRGSSPEYLHFIEEWARPPVPVEFRSAGTIWMAPGSGRVRKGDVVGVVMQPYSGG